MRKGTPRARTQTFEEGLTVADAGTSEGTQWGQCWEVLPIPTGSNCCWNPLLLSRWKPLVGMRENSNKKKQVDSLPPPDFVFSSSFHWHNLTVHQLAKEEGDFWSPSSSFIHTYAHTKDGFGAERQNLNNI